MSTIIKNLALGVVHKQWILEHWKDKIKFFKNPMELKKTQKDGRLFHALGSEE